MGFVRLDLTDRMIQEGTMEPTDIQDQAESTAVEADTEALVEEELLVEEISIDGMCGVY